MNRITLSRMALLFLGLTVFTACSKTSTGLPTAATLTLSSSVTGSVPDGTIVGGYDVTVPLPAGVTVKSATPPQTDEGVVAVSGAATGSTVVSTYTAASGTAPAFVRVVVAKADGIGAGPMITIKSDIAPGACPAIADFGSPTFKASGFDADAGSSANVTGQLTLTESVVLNGSCGGLTTGGSANGAAPGTGSGTNTATGTATGSGSASGGGSSDAKY